MTRRRTLPVSLVLLAALALPAAALARGEVCERPTARGPVSLIILASGAKVHELAESVTRGATVVARDAETVVFDDGRVITADVEAASEHLNRLGWGARGIRVVATFPAKRARPRSTAPG